MYFYAARQPILDRDKNLFAYELLFRDGVENVFPDIDGDEATSRMIAGSQFNFGLDDFLGDKPGFINFTLRHLAEKISQRCCQKSRSLSKFWKQCSQANGLLTECQQLKDAGYTIALDDYIHQPVWRHFYPLIDIIKIDFRETSQETDR